MEAWRPEAAGQRLQATGEVVGKVVVACRCAGFRAQGGGGEGGGGLCAWGGVR